MLLLLFNGLHGFVVADKFPASRLPDGDDISAHPAPVNFARVLDIDH